MAQKVYQQQSVWSSAAVSCLRVRKERWHHDADQSVFAAEAFVFKMTISEACADAFVLITGSGAQQVRHLREAVSLPRTCDCSGPSSY